MSIRRNKTVLPADCAECYGEVCQLLPLLQQVIDKGVAAGEDMSIAQEFIANAKEFCARVGAQYYPEILAEHVSNGLQV